MKFHVFANTLTYSLLGSSWRTAKAFSGRRNFGQISRQNGFSGNEKLIVRGGSWESELCRLYQSTSAASTEEEQEMMVKVAGESKEIIGLGTETQAFGSKEYVGMPSSLYRVVFVLGGPGAGKGTQSAKLVESYDGSVLHLSVGDLLRNAGGSPHAELIESCLVAGKIVPVEISLDLLKQAMEDASRISTCGQPTFLVDGFPRNFDNLEGWTAQMAKSCSVLGALVYECPEAELEKRILARGETSGRSDDNRASIKKRFVTFQDQTMPVVRTLEHIPSLDVKYISGVGSIETVWKKTQQSMNEFLSNDVLAANQKLMSAIQTKNLDLYSQLVQSNSDEIKKQFDEDESLELPSDHENVSDSISNVEIEIQNGTKAVVSYDRMILDECKNDAKYQFRETRVWSHEKEGWMCVHFVRKPIA